MCIIYAGHYFLRSILADVIDYDEFLTGERREGLYFYFLEFIPKLMQVPSQAIPFLMLAHYGYDKDLPTGRIDEDMEKCANATLSGLTLKGCNTTIFARCNATFHERFPVLPPPTWTPWNVTPSICLEQWDYFADLK